MSRLICCECGSEDIKAVLTQPATFKCKCCGQVWIDSKLLKELPDSLKQFVFHINEHITVRLEDEHTRIYVNYKLFTQCAILLVEISFSDAPKYDKIQSIDEIAFNLGWPHQQDEVSYRIPPEVEFMGHCSNLQAWADNNYDTRLLHSNISFPLLKKLVEAGDTMAKRRFKEEIGLRFESGYPPTLLFLLEEKYIGYLTLEERSVLLKNINFTSLMKHQPAILFPLLIELSLLGVRKAKILYKNELYNISNIYKLSYMYGEIERSFKILDNQEFLHFFLYGIKAFFTAGRKKTYFKILKLFISEACSRRILDDENSSSYLIIHSISSQITQENAKDWPDIFCQIIDRKRNTSLDSLIIAELVGKFALLDKYKRISVITGIFINICQSDVIQKQRSDLVRIINIALGGLEEIDDISEVGGGLHMMLTALHRTLFLKEYIDMIRKKLVYFLNNLDPNSVLATSDFIGDIATRIQTIKCRSSRGKLSSLLKNHPVIKKLEKTI